jgi:hypothetical protein
MEDMVELIQKVNILFHHLGIDDPFDVEGKNVIDGLYESIVNVRKIAEFNAIIVHEMIKADLIPPIILKKTELTCTINDLRTKLERLSDKYEMFKENRASKKMLNDIAQEMLTIQREIEGVEKELDSL